MSGWIISITAGVVVVTVLIAYVAERDLRRREQRFQRSLYYCPTSGEVEHPEHGGFDVCCDRPDLHRPTGGAA